MLKAQIEVVNYPLNAAHAESTTRSRHYPVKWSTHMQKAQLEVAITSQVKHVLNAQLEVVITR